MANKIFLIGHRIQYLVGAEQTVPRGVTLHFAVHAGWSSTVGVSTRHLNDELNAYE